MKIFSNKGKKTSTDGEKFCKYVYAKIWLNMHVIVKEFVR